jgi:hypothetical protein
VQLLLLHLLPPFLQVTAPGLREAQRALCSLFLLVVAVEGVVVLRVLFLVPAAVVAVVLVAIPLRF